MGEFQARESLYDRVARFVKQRRGLALFWVGLLLGIANLGFKGYGVDSWWPLVIAIAIAIAGLAWARSVKRTREKAGMAQRAAANVTAHRLRLPTRWKALDEALASYRALTGRELPVIAFKSRDQIGERVDAELAYFTTQADENGRISVASPFAAGADAEAWIAFNEAMLDTYSASELLAVLTHLLYRAEFARGTSGKLANGVIEADSKTLLLTREHAALLRALEKTTPRDTPFPDRGIIRFGDADIIAQHVSTAGHVGKWVIRDRTASLREHLGAMALDVPSGG